jgi:hypothetical protein
MYGEARPSLRAQEYAQGLDIPGERGDPMRQHRIRAFAVTLDGELGQDGEQFIATSGTHDRMLVDVVGATLRIARATIGEDLGEDRVQIVTFDQLDGVEISHETTLMNPEWRDPGFVSKLVVSHPRLPGASLTAEFEQHHSGGRRALDVALRLVASGVASTPPKDN